MSELTEAARAEIKEAIRIVREDRFEKYVRDNHARPVETPRAPEVDEIIVPEKDKPTPPPVKETPVVEKEEVPKRRSAYWGEILE